MNLIVLSIWITGAKIDMDIIECWKTNCQINYAWKILTCLSTHFYYISEGPERKRDQSMTVHSFSIFFKCVRSLRILAFSFKLIDTSSHCCVSVRIFLLTNDIWSLQKIKITFKIGKFLRVVMRLIRIITAGNTINLNLYTIFLFAS